MILLVSFLGWSGFYRFYKKQYLQGVIYFFTAGLFCVGWGLDIYAAIKDERNKPKKAKKVKEPKAVKLKPPTFPEEQKAAIEGGAKFYLESFGSRIAVIYDDRVVFKAKKGNSALMSGVLADSEKTVFYADCIGVSYKDCDTFPGYLKFETASSVCVFDWDKKYQTNERMTEVKLFVTERIGAYKNNT